MSHPNRARAAVAALVLAAGLGTLAGCGSDEQKDAASTGDVSTSVGPGSPSASPSDSSSASGDTPDVTATAGLPEGFPAGDVPLLHEKVLTGSAGDPDGEFAWSVVLQSERAVSEVASDVRKAFTDAGYTAGPGNELGDLSVMQFKGPKYDVGVTAARTDQQVIITYVVKDVG
jgi:hypothetical protein